MQPISRGPRSWRRSPWQGYRCVTLRLSSASLLKGGRYAAKMSDYFTLLASGFALVSDGYQNNLSTVFNLIYVSTPYHLECSVDQEV